MWARPGRRGPRLSWYLGAMLGAIALAWLVVEVGLIRRVTALTRRAAAVSYNVQPAAPGPGWVTWTCPTCADRTGWAFWLGAWPTCCSA